MKQYITYSFYQSSDTNYASVNSITGVVTLNNLTTGDGVRIEATINENDIFNISDAHFYVKIIE